MVKQWKLNEKTLSEATHLGRDYQIFDTDVCGFRSPSTLSQTGPSRRVIGSQGVSGRCPSSLASVADLSLSTVHRRHYVQVRAEMLADR
jgi:hypothetical protein